MHYFTLNSTIKIQKFKSSLKLKSRSLNSIQHLITIISKKLSRLSSKAVKHMIMGGIAEFNINYIAISLTHLEKTTLFLF